MVNIRRDSNHVLAVASWLLAGGRVNSHIDTLTEVMHQGISGRFADACIVVGGMGCVNGKSLSRREDEGDDVAFNLDCDVERISSSDESGGRILRDVGGVFVVWCVMLFLFEGEYVLHEPGMSVRRLAGEATGEAELKGAGGVAWIDSAWVVEDPYNDFSRA